MIEKITNETEYNKVLASIEKYLQKANEVGGFENLSKDEEGELSYFSLLVAEYEHQLYSSSKQEPKGIEKLRERANEWKIAKNK